MKEKNEEVGRINLSDIGSSQWSRLVDGESELLSEIEIEGEKAWIKELRDKDFAFIESVIPKEYDIQSQYIDSEDCCGFETYEIMKDPEIMLQAD